MKTTKSLLVGFALGIATCLLMLVGKRLVFPTALQALPFGAGNIKEEVYINGFLPDFSYKLEADIKPDGFNSFVRRMGFPETSRRNDRLYVVEEREREYQKSAEYRGGTLYFEEWKH
jgi:hypothetical protein